jgi:hypothetical protein
MHNSRHTTGQNVFLERVSRRACRSVELESLSANGSIMSNPFPLRTRTPGGRFDAVVRDKEVVDRLQIRNDRACNVG